ncbi:MAG: MATE family efflux transporter [Lachnospiraceae bacterium]|nr:MATE family efflux transporter [Lachnospiraceae bacterium]
MSTKVDVGTRENKMGVMPVNKLLLNMSLPMMVSMLVQALYNIVDSIFVAKLSENALTAVSLAFPIQTLLIALGTGTGVGVNSLLSKQLGEKDLKQASRTAMNGIFLAVLSYITFVIVGIAGVGLFYESQVKDADPEILTLGVQYLRIVCVCSFGLYAQLIFEKLLQSTGKTLYSMITQAVGAVTNIILDPILIFGLFGMPKLGVAGAAIATVIGQIVGGMLGLIFNIKVNKEITLCVKGFKPDVGTIGNIYKVGVPAIIMQAIGSVMTYGMNQILITFSSTATAVFGVYFKLQSFFFMPVFGLNNGLIPIVAFNYGAGKRSRVVKAIKCSLVYAFALLLVGFIVFETIPAVLLGMFEASEEMLAIGVPALRIIGVHFLIAWFCIIAGSVFQALGNGVYSLVVSVARQLVVLLPVAFILARIGGLHAVWWAFPIAEMMSFCASSLFMIRINKKVISNIPEKVTA